MTAGCWKVLDADDVSPPRLRQCFSLVEANFPCGMTIQKHYPDLGSDTPLVGNFCSHSSGVISQGNQIINFLVLLALINRNNQCYETKEIENQPRLKNFNLNLILTCNIDRRLLHPCTCHPFGFCQYCVFIICVYCRVDALAQICKSSCIFSLTSGELKSLSSNSTETLVSQVRFYIFVSSL